MFVACDHLYTFDVAKFYMHSYVANHIYKYVARLHMHTHRAKPFKRNNVEKLTFKVELKC